MSGTISATRLDMPGLTVTLVETAPHLPASPSLAIRKWENDGLEGGTHHLVAEPVAREIIAVQAAEIRALREALEPSGDTKAAYMGEFAFTVRNGTDDEGEEIWTKFYVPWDIIKEIMKAIRARAAHTQGSKAISPFSAKRSGPPPVEEYREWAIDLHGDQKYGDQPYVVHLDAVAKVLADWGVCVTTMTAAAYLHDVLEDTNLSLYDLETMVGAEISALVWACTGEGETRDDRMASIYAKVALNGRAAAIKLADRIANVRASQIGSRHADRYLAEHQAFSAALKPHVPGHFWNDYVTAISAMMAAPEARADG